MHAVEGSHPGIATACHSVILPPLNPDDAENELGRALLEPLPKTGYLTEAVRHITGHARHRLPEGFVAACAETTERFRSVKAPSRHGKSKLLLAALLGLAVAAAFIVPGAARRELKLLLVTEADQLPDHVFVRFGGQTAIRERILSRVSPADGEILFGDLTAQNIEDRWKALAEREPTNPGRYADAALGYLRSNGKLPPDFVEKGDELDLGNGWYAALEARVTSNRRSSGEPVTRNRGVKTPELVFAASRFRDPTRSMWDQRLTLLPEEELWADVVAATRFMVREMPESGSRFRVRTEKFMATQDAIMSLPSEPAIVNKLLLAWIEALRTSLVITKNREELIALFDDPSSSRSGFSLASYLSAEGLPKEAHAIADLEIECAATLRAARTPPTPTSLLAAKSSTTPCHDPALTRPGIAAEWAMHERLIGWGSVLLLGLLLVIHLAVLQSNRGYDRLAERLGQILRRSDHFFIFLISLGLPLLLYAIATRLPGHGLLTAPLQEEDPRFKLLAILHGAWILTVPLLALEATRWRLAVRGRALGMAGRGLHLGMVPLAMLLGSLVGAAVLPAIPAVWTDPKLPLLGLASGLAIGALWLLVLIVWHFAAPRESFPERLLRLRVVFWPVLAALLVTAAGMVALREHERHLVSINRFEKSPRTHAGNPTAADQEFLETWKPKLLDAARQAQEKLEALE